jgi:hypothetical protein
MATNKRIFYAIQQVSIRADGAGPGGAYAAAHGVQSVGMTTTFNLEQAFELGQLAIYENIEGIPDVEMTLTKVLDGYPLVWHLATQDAGTPDLAGRSVASAYAALSIFDDTDQSAGGTPTSEVEMSGMFVSSLAYNFPLEDNFTEDVTLVGNNKVWANDTRVNALSPGQWPGSSSPNIAGDFASNTDSPPGSGGVQRRENMQFAISSKASGTDLNGMLGDPDTTILPLEVFGISATGTNEKIGNDFSAHITNISVSADLGREELFELGRRGPYHRVVTFPVEVTCEIETTATSGDMVSATEAGILATDADICKDATNLSDRTIRIATCEGTRVYLGLKNKLASVNYTGGDAGGGNVSVSYTYTTFNDFTVLHPQDPNALGSTWWEDRDTYLVTRT